MSEGKQCHTDDMFCNECTLPCNDRGLIKNIAPVHSADRDHFRIPEWLCILLYTIATAAICFALFIASIPKEKIIRYAMERPTVYVVARNQYANLDGGIIWSLEYTINGEMQIPANFQTEKEMIRFEQYLYRAARRVE